MEVRITRARDLAEPMKLLEEFVRDGEPLPRGFVKLFREEVERGGVEVPTAYENDSAIGVAVVALRPSISIGDRFASIEDIYVKPEARRQGIGRAMLEAVEEFCAAKGISYVEVQAVEEDAVTFYRSLGYEPESGVRVLYRSVALREEKS